MGYVLMLIYACLQWGRLNWVEFPFITTLAGISSVLLGLLITVSVMQMFGYPFIDSNQMVFALTLGMIKA